MRPPIAPIGLEYVADALERRGYEPRPCDLAFEDDWRPALGETLADLRPMVVAVSVRNLDDAYFASRDFVLEETARIVRYARERTDAPVVLGGVGFSIAPREVLRFAGADYGIAGDGEDALPDLLDCLRTGGDPGAVPGCVRWRNGDVEVSRPIAACDVSRRPAPRRRYFDNPRYFAEGGQAGVETKRGCARLCAYCVEPAAKGRTVRLREPDSVVDEFRDLVEQGIDAVHLCDSEFNLPADHARAVCEALASAGLGERLRWYTYAFPQAFDGDLALAMARAGCVGVNFGVDHVDAGILGRLGRRYGEEDIRRTAEACREAGLAVMFDLLLGSPGETRETLARAIGFMRDVAPDRVGLSCGVRVYPNTPLAERVRCEGAMERNPNLHGERADNEDFLRPLFYVDARLDGDIHGIVSELVDGDERFFHANPSQLDGNYNYNDNSVLANAIRDGARGAYWDILRRV